MSTIPIVWTNDDICVGTSAQLQRQLDLLDPYNIPGVFFVIPSGGGGPDLDQDTELLKLIESARTRGHEFYQHGYKHFAFECGIPCLQMFELDVNAVRLFDADRDYIESLHTLEALVEMLENGQRIWRRAFGEDSEGFRPGWGSYCGNLYKALKILGYKWVSSRIPSMTAYLQKYGQPIQFAEGIKDRDFPIGHSPVSGFPEAAVKSAPYLLKQGIWEFPIGPEIAWRIPNDPEKIDAMVELGMASFEIMHERQEPMLMVSHHHGLGFKGELEGNPPLESGTGYAVHEKFLPKVLATGKARFIGMKELSAAYVA